ncbi:hypothetical protein FM037_11770 [Shewanella psychropiezotolerans]|uniref:Orphan protein n=1 Tax=Shewanella psychropiezotolerans TaxID=2593655 RepID=A0ABX5WYE5_9GAMM|nr:MULTISPECIES: hypothetical protein [Shewanella]MPY26543.1 hypothetical protein [Shewanella sp. YLB-07]QDO83793.1 hypothetical protein FM037_11770 [Shewanella psychropiezotolerans]
MKYCQYCFLINKPHCVNICVLSLDPSRYVFSQLREYWYLTHPEYYDPIAIISEQEKETITFFKQLLEQLKSEEVKLS